MAIDEDQTSNPSPSYSRFACIGSGFSAIGLGATLQRWYGIDDVRFFERHSQLGGTWFVNQYPGAACDVPSALYSFSFEANAEWSRALPARDELWAYLKRVADKYDLPRRMTFNAAVERCEWIESRSVWRLHIRDTKTDTVSTHECQFLFAGTGGLVVPRKLDVPGASSFQGPIFHSAQWRNDVDLTGKRVVLFGNGCTAAQIVPSIVGDVAHLTQIVRTKHWIFPPPVDAASHAFMKLLTRYVPGSMLLQRFLVFLAAERSFTGFHMTARGAAFRRKKRAEVEAFMRRYAPEKYHDLLIPDFEIGCKRRIFDPGYLASLHSPNMTLTSDQAVEILPSGVRTASGALIEADVIILANGFVTNGGEAYFPGITVVGRGGETAPEHWARLYGESGRAGAYNSTALAGFPNFFALLGPNAATGHTSTVMAIENSINYALRVIAPLLRSDDGEGQASAAEVKLEAERAYTERVQADLGKTVFASGCRSWYVERSADGREWNAATYPWSQAYFWWRSLFPVWRDWVYTGPNGKEIRVRRRSASLVTWLALFTAIVSVLYAKRSGGDVSRYAAIVKAGLTKVVSR